MALFSARLDNESRKEIFSKNQIFLFIQAPFISNNLSSSKASMTSQSVRNVNRVLFDILRVLTLASSFKFSRASYGFWATDNYRTDSNRGPGRNGQY